MSRVRLSIIGSAVVVLGLAPTAFAAAGDLDQSWGQSGTVTVEPAEPGGNVQGTKLAQQNRGTIVASKTSTYDPMTWQSDADLMVQRLDATGQRDRSFGSDGLARVDFPAPAYLADVAVLMDDRLAVLATVNGGSFEDNQVGLARLLPDGAADPAFNSGSPVVTDLRGQALSPRAVVPSNDGGLLVGLNQDGPIGRADFAVAKYDASGVLDPSFGDGGIRLVDVGGDDRLNDLIAGPAGDLFAVGSTSTGQQSSAAVVRLGSDGSVDVRFGAGGVARVALAGQDVYASSAVVAGRGIVIAGSALSQDAQAAFVARLSMQGRLEMRFGRKGVLLMDEPGQFDGAGPLAATADGALLVGRQIGDGPFTARIHKLDAATGKPTVAFGDNGAVDLGEFALTGLLPDGEGLLDAGTRFDASGPVEVVQRRQ